MTPIDWNNSNTPRRSSGRFGEPEQPYSPQVDSLKLPKRRGSFDGDISLEEDEKLQGDKAGCCSSHTMLLSEPYSASNHHGRHTRLRRRSFRRPSFEVPSIENSNTDLEEDDDYLCLKAAQQHQHHHSTDFEMTIRRASTGTKLIARTQPLFDDSEEPQKPRRCSLSGPRPCMESTLGSGRDAPIMRRRSLGGTRPCMENTSSYDGPILRPYRQLSSDDLCIDMGCIGEETDEDLRSNRSNRSCLIHDFSNRSNRTALVHEFSSRSNRSNLVKEISNRSLAKEISNRSTFRDFSTRSRTIVEGPSAAMTSPEREEFSEVQEEPSESSSFSPLPATPPEHSLSSRPRPWPVQKSVDDLEISNTSLCRSKTWPTNLMILLSMKKLPLESNLVESDEESDDCDNEENDLSDGSPHRRKRNSNSPYRSNSRLLRTIHKASDIIEGEEPKILSILDNF